MAAKKDTAEIVIEQIEKLLESDNLKWDNGRLNIFKPFNPTSKRAYRGINVFTLAMRTMAEGWEHPHFMTFNQAKKLGAKVMKGATSEVVVFWKFNQFADKKDPEKMVQVPLLRFYRVFNIAQIEGLPERFTNFEAGEAVKVPEAEEVADAYLNSQNIDVVPHFGSPYYSPGKDCIGMPPLEDFKSTQRYYESLFHEMVHSTGNEKRLKRFTPNSYPGSGEYAREELIAEYGAAILMAETGTAEGFENFAAYLKSWWKRIKENPRDLVVAAGKAQKGVEFITAIVADLDKEDVA